MGLRQFGAALSLEGGRREGEGAWLSNKVFFHHPSPLLFFLFLIPTGGVKTPQIRRTHRRWRKGAVVVNKRKLLCIIEPIPVIPYLKVVSSGRAGGREAGGREAGVVMVLVVVLAAGTSGSIWQLKTTQTDLYLSQRRVSTALPGTVSAKCSVYRPPPSSFLPRAVLF